MFVKFAQYIGFIFYVRIAKSFYKLIVKNS